MIHDETLLKKSLQTLPSMIFDMLNKREYFSTLQTNKCLVSLHPICILAIPLIPDVHVALTHHVSTNT